MFCLTQTQSSESYTDTRNHDFIPCTTTLPVVLHAEFNDTLALHDNVTGILQLEQSNKMSYKGSQGCDTYNGKFNKVSTKHSQCTERKPQYNGTYFHDVNTLQTWRAQRILTQVAIPCTMTPFMKVRSLSAECTHFCACSRFTVSGLDPHHNTGHQSISPETSPMLSCTW
jgi:hypothetical protein